jgi:hypothetical protein
MDLQTIHNDLQLLHNKVDRIENLLESYIKPSCNEMSEHIHFIKHVYDTIKTPLHYVSERIQKYIVRKECAIAFPTTDVIDYSLTNNE